jgi:hypothetical protein
MWHAVRLKVEVVEFLYVELSDVGVERCLQASF